MDRRNLGIALESREDNGEDSKPIDWGFIFTLLKNRGFSHKEILQLSYPQFNAYMNYINDETTFNITIPYLGSSEDSKKPKTGSEISSKEELLSIVSSMNNDFS